MLPSPSSPREGRKTPVEGPVDIVAAAQALDGERGRATAVALLALAVGNAWELLIRTARGSDLAEPLP